jgi:DNA-binding SARP family transcriptional activator
MTADAARFRILGPLTVIDDEGRTVALGGLRQRCFLALLLLSPNTVLSVDALIDAIWGERPPASALTMLHQFASRLRPVVQPSAQLVTRKPGYLLEVDPRAIDAEQFSSRTERGKTLIAEGDLEGGRRELDAGLRLWSGSALEDLRFEVAIAPHAELLEEQRLAALEERIAADIELGRQSDVIGELQGLVAAHPERERLSGLLMLALYGAGRQAEALSVYDALRRHLAVELGISPGPFVEELHAEILRHDPTLGTPGPRRVRIGGRSLSPLAVGIAVLATAALVAGLVSLGVVLSTRGGGGTPRSSIPPDERLPFPPVPDELLGAYTAAIPAGQSAQTMTLRAPDDPVCKPLLAGKGTCFLIHPTENELDPGARGQAAFHDGMVVLRYTRIPFVPQCQQEVDRYRVTPDHRRLVLDERVIVKGPLDSCSFTAFVRNVEG